ncbi:MULTISPECIES: YggS family pyridoxal phosphate-dependent enzyme [Pacificibacter]|uniref:YggS family pyridoxal phosphate-dependent enzyme n=1 Tax=Pacificibacter TaxID=1042323 RepID=UPI001C0A443C|nr:MULTISPECIES: YggS family pyridoxal phosphate-dependent enzyme [Pacificibacter]MBU2936016.1 YggS family pyridoxal phosphate-dependent enzyme [Pacificibacter marinus]MDO6615135.1 YggS family pyridoxal phosphate-dependent enzyme [Pacificibacter sp. 1_MG-2023]
MGLSDIQNRVEKEALRVGRDPETVQLIAVSKVQPNARVEMVLQQGQRVFGENRVQEAAGKWPAFKEVYAGVELHLIGPMQSNKVRQAMELFDVIHTVDRPKIAQTIARIKDETGSCPRLYIQVNTGAEPQKAGVLPDEADAFIKMCTELSLPIEGLMCIPPSDQDASTHFALLADIAKRNGLEGLSMGMSGDFEQAIAHGATYVRVGSAIFGERTYEVT